MPLSEDRKREIINALTLRGASTSACPRCGNTTWTIIDGYLNNTIQFDFQNITIGGPSIPTVGIVCTRCGFLSQHALGVLGLLPQDEQKREDEK